MLAFLFSRNYINQQRFRKLKAFETPILMPDRQAVKQLPV
jgi:hypothetical protein